MLEEPGSNSESKNIHRDHSSKNKNMAGLLTTNTLPYDRILDNGITYNDIIYHSAVVPMAPREDTIR